MAEHCPAWGVVFKAAWNLKIKILHTMTKRKIGNFISLFIRPNNEMFSITINRLPGALDLKHRLYTYMLYTKFLCNNQSAYLNT